MEAKKKSEAKAPKKAKTTKAKVVKPKAEKVVKKAQGFSIQKYFSGIRNNFRENKNLYVRYGVITLIIILIGVFVFFKKNWFVVAVVNGQPITSVDFYQNLKAKSGKDVLDQMIRDRLVAQEAVKKGITIAESDINKKVSEIEKQVGGKEQLKSALIARSITEAEFRNQIKLQLTVEKILAKDIAVTDKEVDDFIAKNPTDPNVASDKGPNKTAIKEQLKSQKLNEKFQPWYDKLEKDAKISRFEAISS